MLKSAREKQKLKIQKNPHKLNSRFFNRNSEGQKVVAGYI